MYIYICIYYIRHRALGHQWSVSNALAVCRSAFCSSLRDSRGAGPHKVAQLA